MKLHYNLKYSGGYSQITLPELEGKPIIKSPDEVYCDDSYLDLEHFCFTAGFDPYNSTVFTTIKIQKESGGYQSARATSDYERLTRKEADGIISEIIRTTLGIENFEVDTDSNALIEANEIIDEVYLEDYCGYSFAMETVNGEIISMTDDFQTVLKNSILEKFSVSEENLCDYLFKRQSEDDYEDEDFDFLNDFDFDFLAEILGYYADENVFDPYGLDFLESPYGWETKDLLEQLDFELEDDSDSDPRGLYSSGVIYYDE